MKIQLDTTAKTIKVEDEVNLGELMETIQKILPDNWKEFKVMPSVITNWSNPIYIDRWHPSPWYHYQNQYPFQVYCGDRGSTAGLIDCANTLTSSQHVYNLQVN